MDTPRPARPRRFRATSVSSRAETLKAARARMGRRSASSSSEGAVQRQLQREAIDQYIATVEAEYGPVDPAEVAAKAERIRAHHDAHRGAPLRRTPRERNSRSIQ